MDKAIPEKVDFLLKDFKPKATGQRIWILNSGDMSKYHELIVLENRKGMWYLTEDYLTSEHSYSNTWMLIDVKDIREWLLDFVARNKKYIVDRQKCPSTGLCNPETYNGVCKQISKEYFPLSEYEQILSFLVNTFRQYMYIGSESALGMGDVTFFWAFISGDKKSLLGIEGISYYAGEIGLNNPQKIMFESEIDITDDKTVKEMIYSNFGWKIGKLKCRHLG